MSAKKALPGCNLPLQPIKPIPCHPNPSLAPQKFNAFRTTAAQMAGSEVNVSFRVSKCWTQMCLCLCVALRSTLPPYGTASPDSCANYCSRVKLRTRAITTQLLFSCTNRNSCSEALCLSLSSPFSSYKAYDRVRGQRDLFHLTPRL